MKEVHPLTKHIPVRAVGMDLSMDIAHNGQREPIMLYEGKIIEGRVRYPACLEAGIVPQFKNLPDGEDPMDFMVQRHIDSWQPDQLDRIRLLAEVMPYYKHKRGPFAPRLARVTGIGQHSVRRVRALHDMGKLGKVLSGEQSISEAMRKAGMGERFGGRRAYFGRSQFGRGDRFDETVLPFRHYLAAHRKRGFEFTHVNPKEAQRRVKILEEMAEDIRGALADLTPRAIRPKHRASDHPKRRNNGSV